jgi:hypothetical protein
MNTKVKMNTNKISVATKREPTIAEIIIALYLLVFGMKTMKPDKRILALAVA